MAAMENKAQDHSCRKMDSIDAFRRVSTIVECYAAIFLLWGRVPNYQHLPLQYSARIPYYNARYLIAPGLTGWAQVRHDRDPHHGTDVAETKMKLSYDLYYLARRSLLLDLFIMLQTVRIFVTARGS